MRSKFFPVIFIMLSSLIISCSHQKSDEKVIQSIFEEALSDSTSYKNLEKLTKTIGGRLACSPEGIEAVNFTKEIMKKMDLDQVYLQEMMVKNWDRGNPEEASIHSARLGKEEINVCALGRGIGTNGNPLSGQVIEVTGLKELKSLPREKVKDKIIFFNGAMNPNRKNTFHAYGEAAGQRFYGPVKAAEYGAKGAIIRSLTTKIDTFPHTGVTKYAEPEKTVPAVSIATKHANLLHEWLQEDPELTVSFTTWCQNKPDTVSYNVIGELRGTEYPNKIITVGGHLDAWDNSPGAHDDGAGCMHAVEVLRIFKELGIKPRHTIRAVMFMDEEVSQMGGETYAEEARGNGEEHVFALESDRGATKPLGFSINAADSVLKKLQSYRPLFEPYGIKQFEKGGGGVDINPLKRFNTVLVGYVPDPTHYFDWHHSGNDTFDQVDFREFQSGSAAIASLIYLVDRHGI